MNWLSEVLTFMNILLKRKDILRVIVLRFIISVRVNACEAVNASKTDFIHKCRAEILI
jgi:hypothetical protein